MPFIINLMFATVVHAQIFDCGENLKSIAPNRPVFGVSEGKLVELERVNRQIKKVSVIVPVYRELANGNLPRLMEILRGQTLSPKRLEVVLVVNNSVISASQADSVFAENQATLLWLHQNDFPFKLKIVDLSSKGVERNMGFLRQVGAQAALDQEVALDQHVLVFMDADTAFRSDHLARLVQVYKDFGVDMVLSRLGFEVRDRNNLETFFSHHAYQNDTRYGMFQRALRSAQDGVGAPQISALAKSFKSVGGFPNLEHAEDLGLIKNFAHLKTFYAPFLKVLTEDRARPDGFDTAYRFSWNQNFDWTTRIGPPSAKPILRDLFLPLKNRQAELISHRKISPYTGTVQLGREIESITKVEPPLLHHPDLFASHPLNRFPGFDAWALGKIFDVVYDSFTTDPGELSLNILTASLDQRTNRDIDVALDERASAHDHLVLTRRQLLIAWSRGQTWRCDSPDLFIQFFCAPSSKLREFFTRLKLERANEDELLSLVVEMFPDHLDFWDRAENVRENAMFEIGETCLLSGFHDPDSYPGLQKFFR